MYTDIVALRSFSPSSLYFSPNNSGVETAEVIAVALPNNKKKLEKVYLLNCNSLCTAGVNKIADSLQSIATLTSVGLSNSNIDGDSSMPNMQYLKTKITHSKL